MASVLVHPSLDSLVAIEVTSDQRRLRSDSADVQADLSLCWSHKSNCMFCRALALVVYFGILNPFWLLRKSNTTKAGARGNYNPANYTAVFEET